MKKQDKRGKTGAEREMEAGTDQERREEELKEILSYYSSMTSPSSQENCVYDAGNTGALRLDFC